MRGTGERRAFLAGLYALCLTIGAVGGVAVVGPSAGAATATVGQLARASRSAVSDSTPVAAMPARIRALAGLGGRTRDGGPSPRWQALAAAALMGWLACRLVRRDRRRDERPSGWRRDAASPRGPPALAVV